jgi:hypothetical protein
MSCQSDAVGSSMGGREWEGELDMREQSSSISTGESSARSWVCALASIGLGFAVSGCEGRCMVVLMAGWSACRWRRILCIRLSLSVACARKLAQSAVEERRITSPIRLGPYASSENEAKIVLWRDIAAWRWMG